MSELVTVFGGSGFVGKYVVRALCKAGYRVRVAMRRPHLGNDLRVMGAVGQVQLVQANVKNSESVARAVAGSDAIINLVAILFEKGSQKFEAVVEEGAKNIANAARDAGISKFVQISAIHDVATGAKYAIAKDAAEKAIKEIIPTATILRPSVIFGTEDQFFNKFAAMSRITPIMPLIGGGKTKFQPVYVNDVAGAVIAALNSANAQGKTFELGGPKTYTFEEILRYIQTTINRPRIFASVPLGLMAFKGSIIDFASRFIPFMKPAFTGDQMKLLKADNIVADGALGFKDLGIDETTTVEAIAPSYLYRFRPHGQFEPRVV
jgi:uncharacterized protein YbjT (DUF2867 family)